jgi:hypothetical protein
MLGTVIWLSTALVVLTALYLALTSVWWPLAAVIVSQMVALRRFREEIGAILSTREPGAAADFVAYALTHRSLELDALAELLTHLERARFKGTRLVLLHGRLTSAGLPASRTIRRLHRLSETHDSQTNAAAFPLGLFLFGVYTGRDWMLGLALIVAGLLLLVRPHLALAIERWRSRHGHRVRVWIETIAQFEALSSLAGYRYEHEDDPFPEVVPPGAVAPAKALFDGRRRCSTACSLDIRYCRVPPWCRTTCAWLATRPFSWSAGRTCRERARCYARWGSTR